MYKIDRLTSSFGQRYTRGYEFANDFIYISFIFVFIVVLIAAIVVIIVAAVVYLAVCFGNRVL